MVISPFPAPRWNESTYKCSAWQYVQMSFWRINSQILALLLNFGHELIWVTCQKPVDRNWPWWSEVPRTRNITRKRIQNFERLQLLYRKHVRSKLQSSRLGKNCYRKQSCLC